jgi:hypothetical protein
MGLYAGKKSSVLGFEPESSAGGPSGSPPIQGAIATTHSIVYGRLNIRNQSPGSLPKEIPEPAILFSRPSLARQFFIIVP